MILVSDPNAEASRPTDTPTMVAPEIRNAFRREIFIARLRINNIVYERGVTLLKENRNARAVVWSVGSTPSDGLRPALRSHLQGFPSEYTHAPPRISDRAACHLATIPRQAIGNGYDTMKAAIVAALVLLASFAQSNLHRQSDKAQPAMALVGGTRA
jgi:hypothetical protein